MGCIYRIYLKNDLTKNYIGQYVKDNPYKRWKRHIYDTNKHLGKQEYFHNAIRLYGETAFIIECLCVCSRDSLNSLEAYYAEQYNSYWWDGGYNMVECGTKSPIMNEITRHKMSIAKKGKKLSEEHRLNVARALIGRPVSEETKQKISKSNIGKIMPSKTEEQKKVVSEKLKGREFTDEHKLRLSENAKKRELKKKESGIVDRPNSKFTKEQVLEIHRLRGVCILKVIADKYNVSISTISNILKGVTYKEYFPVDSL